MGGRIPMVRNGILMLCAIVMFSCADKGCSFNSGSNTSFILPVDTFRSVKLFANANVFLYQDSVHSIEIEGDELLINNFSTEWEKNEEGNRIRVIDNSACNFLRNYQKPNIHIYSPNLQSLVLQGSCNVISVDTLPYPRFTLIALENLNEVDITVQSELLAFYNYKAVGGIYTFRGYTTYADIGVYANASIRASELETFRTKFRQNSVVDSYLGFSDSLIIHEFTGSGSLYYHSASNIRVVSKSGSGELIAH
jgi:hypothetical protein